MKHGIDNATGIGAGDDAATAPVVLLHIGDMQTTVTSSHGNQPQRLIVLDIGAQRTAAAYFRHTPPTAIEMENAIMAVEDEVTRASKMVDGSSALLTTDAAIREIALLSGVPQLPVMILSLEAMERTFDRLAAVTLGRPVSQAGIPATPAFAATLLILREFMHHLQFAAITIQQPLAA